jgi:Skp family chaperone for outer membrane proteins
VFLAQVFDYNALADGEEADVDADAASAAAEQEAKLREAKARDRYVDSLNRIRATGAGARGSVANANGLAAVAPKQKVRYILFVAAV